MPEFHLERVIPENNCFRYYGITVEKNMFGDSSLIIRWGRIGRRGEERIVESGAKEYLNERAKMRARLKMRRGYLET